MIKEDTRRLVWFIDGEERVKVQQVSSVQCVGRVSVCEGPSSPHGSFFIIRSQIPGFSQINEEKREEFKSSTPRSRSEEERS